MMTVDVHIMSCTRRVSAHQSTRCRRPPTGIGDRRRTVMLVLGLGLIGLFLRTCLKYGLGIGLVIKSLAFGWPCQFVLEIVHQADSQVTVSCQFLSGNVRLSLLLKVLIWADSGLVS